MSGFRVGFAVGNKDMIQALKSTKRTQMLDVWCITKCRNICFESL